MSAALESLMRQVDAPSQRGRLETSGLGSFLLIGASATAVYVLLSSMLVVWLQGYAGWAVNAACYASLVVPVYLLHRRFSFRSERAHREALPRYAAVQATSLLLTMLFGFVVYGTLALPSLFSALLIAGLTSGFSFLVLKGWAFAAPGRPATIS